MGEGGERREEGSGISMVLPVVRSKMGFRLVLGALCVGAVVGLSLAVALPATQAAEQVSSQVKGCHPFKKVQFFLTLFKRPLTPPPFYLNICPILQGVFLDPHI